MTTTLATFVSIFGIVISSACTTTKPAEIVTRAPAVRSCASQELQQKIEDIAKVTGGPVGAVVMLLETQQVVWLNAGQHYPMQSVFKLPIALLVYHRVDKGKLSLDQKVKIEPVDFVNHGEFSLADKYPKGAELTIRALLSYLIKESDSTASDVLMRLLGGPEEVTKELR